ncbi:right-handed parallel beta-helix repeat-containing protein [Kitasatospora sp. NPDC058263]
MLVTLVAVAATGCSATDSQPSGKPHPAGNVVRVPEDFATVQQAVDIAREGDTVLIQPGVYRESVRVTVPRVVVRGTDRNAVVLDGGVRLVNGITVTGAGSVVENLTVRGFLANGVLFTGVTDDQLQRRGAGGSAYDPLDTVRFPPVQGFRASRVTAYNNGLYGIYAFDARGGVIEDSYASGGADSGIYVGQCKPCDTLVRGNTVERNAVGIEITNASDNLTVLGNRVVGNRVEGNHATANGVDLVLASTDPANCFTGNSPATQSPNGLEEVAGCGAAARQAVPAGRPAAVEPPPGTPFNSVPVPPAQPSMPDPSAPGRPATDLPGPVDPNRYPLPTDVAAMPQPN